MAFSMGQQEHGESLCKARTVREPTVPSKSHVRKIPSRGQFCPFVTSRVAHRWDAFMQPSSKDLQKGPPALDTFQFQAGYATPCGAPPVHTCTCVQPRPCINRAALNCELPRRWKSCAGNDITHDPCWVSLRAPGFGSRRGPHS